MTMASHPQFAYRTAPSVGMAIGAMTAIQLAAALSRPLTAEIGAPAVTWLRMAAAALILIALTRPQLKLPGRSALWPTLVLGGVLGLMSVAFFAAVARLPLGLVATISFLGPLTVAVVGAKAKARPLALGLALTAGVGVLLIVAPLGAASADGWGADPTGLALALMAAVLWGLYIVLMRRVGHAFSGTEGLCVSLLTAAVLLTPSGIASFDHLPAPSVILGAAGLGLLAPLMTCWLEMKALRNLGTQSFGILMSLEPAIAALLGLLILHEVPSGQQFLGMVYVIIASAASVWLADAD